MSDGHLKISNVIEDIAEKLPNTRFGRSYKYGIGEDSDYPYSGELMTRMSQVLRDINIGIEPDMEQLEREVNAFVSTQVSIGQALAALTETLLDEGRMKKAEHVRRLQYFHDVVFG